MDIINLVEKLDSDIKLNRAYTQLGELLKELNNKGLPNEIINSINMDVEELNSTPIPELEFKKLLVKKQTKIITLLEKELKIVPKEYYRKLWLTLGMATFGLPIGLAIGIAVGNIGLLAIGLPIGIGIGSVVGSKMDKKAANEGRQLDLEIKY